MPCQRQNSECLGKRHKQFDTKEGNTKVMKNYRFKAYCQLSIQSHQNSHRRNIRILHWILSNRPHSYTNSNKRETKALQDISVYDICCRILVRENENSHSKKINVSNSSRFPLQTINLPIINTFNPYVCDSQQNKNISKPRDHYAKQMQVLPTRLPQIYSLALISSAIMKTSAAKTY